VNGTIGSAPCTIFARMTVHPFPTQRVMWMLERFPTRAAAEQARTPSGAVVEMDHGIWLLSVGAHRLSRQGVVPVAEVGPLPLPPATSYEILFAYVGVPAGARSAVHVQSGPEAWYVLSGSQCVETPTTVQHIAEGQTGFVPADTPLYLVATGTGVRRAFFVIIHDAARPFYTEINTWRPRGLCAPGAG
jgi:quercetin dioxygenase-like cupin family protein